MFTKTFYTQRWLTGVADPHGPYRGDFDTNLSLEDIKNQELL